MEESWNGEDLDIDQNELDNVSISDTNEVLETNIFEEEEPKEEETCKEELEETAKEEEIIPKKDTEPKDDYKTYILKYKYMIVVLIAILFSNSYFRDLIPENFAYMKNIIPLIAVAIFIIYTEYILKCN